MEYQKRQFPKWLARGIVDVFPSENDNEGILKRLEESIKSKKPLRIKLGIDPTGSEIHLGHSILFRKLRAFQDAGHTAILIIGDFTARIGDPTGKNKTRVQLNPDQIKRNASTYLEQLGYGQSPDKSLLDFRTPGRLEIHRNSKWFEDFDLAKIISLLGQSTVGQMLAKEDFSKRYSSGIPIALHEFLYPLLQGYDSFAVNSDLEIGGTDQKFNVAIGRDVQRHFGQDPQFGLLLPILNGLDGSQKMSKSLNNFVGIKEDALSMYSKLEKLDDKLVISYLTLLTDLDLNNLPEDPREVQKLMALTITANFHGFNAASAAQSNSQKLVLGLKGNVEEIEEVSIANVKFPVKAFYLLSAIGLSPSSSEAKRQIQGGSVRLEGNKIENPAFEFFEKNQLLGKVLQIGKKTFRRIID